MLKEKSIQARRTAIRTIRRKQEEVFRTSVSVGKCCDCALEDVCRFSNKTDETCRAVDFAIKEFQDFVYKAGTVKPVDALAVRTLSSIWGSIILAELYFKHYGSVIRGMEGGKKAYAFSVMHGQYLRLLEKMQVGLDRLGLSPAGRKALFSGLLPQVPETTKLTEYVSKKYGGLNGNSGTTETSQHSRLLQGPSTSGSPSSGHARSTPKSDVRPSSDKESAGIVSLDDWGESSSE